MYVQVTEKCNHHCAHCCYSCTMEGKHATKEVWQQMIRFASEYNNEFISIGGGEPTLHPDFFEILEWSLDDFRYVWMASNGSQTKIMRRLHDIMQGEDYDECDCLERHGEEMYEEYGCLCHEKYDTDTIHMRHDDQLSVALSQDIFHDEINQQIVDLWKNMKYEIRNVSDSHDGVAAQGRAKETGSGWSDHCVCSTWILKINGDIRLCGCEDAPIIGDIWNGITDEWQTKFEEHDNIECHQDLEEEECDA